MNPAAPVWLVFVRWKALPFGAPLDEGWSLQGTYCDVFLADRVARAVQGWMFSNAEANPHVRVKVVRFEPALGVPDSQRRRGDAEKVARPEGAAK